uniref:Transmembrane emp24 domain-containing protein 5 n=1 Tax=Cacopsylla melanoneura TaxID=428564 RepID=A0A8D8ZKF0_9HEMI
MDRNWYIFCLSLVCSLKTILAGSMASVPTTTGDENAPWYENLPAVAMDYKIHIDAGKEDCFFQYVNPGATFYVNFQVLRGGDGMAGFAVRNPNGQIVHPYEWKKNAEYQDTPPHGGYYSVCIDNQFSRNAGKLVNMYLTVVRYDQWDKYHKEIEDLNVSVQNFTESVRTVERNINEMLAQQYHARSREARDYNLLEDNNRYVMNWSLTQILVIAATTCVQVYFVRQLFNSKTNKPRA